MKSRTIALAAAAAALGLGADQAAASYKASVQAGTLKVTGDNAADKLVLSLRPAAPTILELDVGADGTADFAFDRLGFAAIDVAASGGDDEVRVDQRFGAFFDEALTVDGGAGADMLLGGSGMDTLRGGSGNDVVTGGDGNDRALLGSGNDRTVWNPGDDNDAIDGESGSDSLEFNGSGAPERVEVSANGPRVRFTRDVANVVTDLDGVERVAFRAAGSSDMVGVHPLAGTDLETVDIDLQTDGQPDNVVVIGSADDDRIAAGGDGAAVVVDGIGAETRISGAEAQDAITLRGQAGADVIASGPGVPGPATVRAEGDGGADTAIYDGTNGPETFEVVAITGEAVAHSAAAAPFAVMTTVESFALRGNGGADTIAGLGNLAGVTPLTMDGGSGDDVLRGGNGGDLLVGGSGDDVADGNQGQDTARLGSGNDQYWWDPGDSSTVVDGEGGSDAFESNGSNAGETVAFSAVGPSARRPASRATSAASWSTSTTSSGWATARMAARTP